jgi:hypothetical protein
MTYSDLTALIGMESNALVWRRNGMHLDYEYYLELFCRLLKGAENASQRGSHSYLSQS